VFSVTASRVGRAPSSPAVLVYAVVSAETKLALELFVRREDAERFLEEVRGRRARASRAPSPRAVELDA
jgi:hypothetical protein